MIYLNLKEVQQEDELIDAQSGFMKQENNQHKNETNSNNDEREVPKDVIEKQINAYE